MANSSGGFQPVAAFDPTMVKGDMDAAIEIENIKGGMGGPEDTLLNTLDEPVITTIRRDVKIFPSRYSPLQLSVPATALSWLVPSPSSSCIVTGQENGCIGVTWYPTNPSSPPSSHSSSITLSYECLDRITHIRSSAQHSHVAVGDSNGTLMLLTINEPQNGVSRMLTSISSPPQTIVGVDWSGDGTHLACLRANSQRANTLSLLVYSNLSHTQIGHTEVSFPRHVVRRSFLLSERNRPSQRIAWSLDDSSLFLTLPDDSLLQLSAHSWQIISKTSLAYSTHIQLISPTLLLATDTDSCLLLYQTVSHSVKQLCGNVENWVRSLLHDMVLVVTNHADNGRRLSFLNSSGSVLSSHPLSASDPVAALSLSPDSLVLTLSTGGKIYSLLLYTAVPSLADLCMQILELTNRHHQLQQQLPRRVQQQLSIHHNVLFYPWSLSSCVELCVCNLERRSALGNSQRVLLVKKDHLGQELDILRFTQSLKPWKRCHKISELPPAGEPVLSQLLPTSLLTPPANSKIKWNPGRSEFSARTGPDKMRLRFREDALSVEMGGEDELISVIGQNNGLISLKLPGGEALANIIHENNMFRLTLYNLPNYSHLHILVFILAYIIRNF